MCVNAARSLWHLRGPSFEALHRNHSGVQTRVRAAGWAGLLARRGRGAGAGPGGGLTRDAAQQDHALPRHGVREIRINIVTVLL